MSVNKTILAFGIFISGIQVSVQRTGTDIIGSTARVINYKVLVFNVITAKGVGVKVGFIFIFLILNH